MKITMVPFGLSKKSKNKGEEVMKKVLFVLLFVVAALVLVSGQSYAISGACGSCHTMHNSQLGAPMNYNASATPNAVLLRGTCFGCHAQNTASNGPSSANSIPPQVLHTNAIDLAGGNFDQVVLDKTRGHNIVGLGGMIADTFPGGVAPGGTQAVPVTCAGGNDTVNTGCHGIVTGAAGISSNMMTAMAGSHHGNVNGQLNTATTVANSYRFLLGVKGTEDTDWQHTSSATDHNEYFSDAAAGYGISDLCARCHGTFHGTGNTLSGGEWIRHPTEITIGATYATTYTNSYSTTVPVGRTTVAAASSDVAGADTVVCTSCHVAHGSPYADAIRWDYANNTTGDGAGCNKCHGK